MDAEEPDSSNRYASGADDPRGQGMERTIRLVYERDTKRTYRFQEESDDPVVGTLYVKKGAFKQRPKEIEVTIRAED